MVIQKVKDIQQLGSLFSNNLLLQESLGIPLISS